MGFGKNLLDAGIITMAFYFGSLAIEGAGIDFVNGSAFTTIGVTVSFLLAFMETTYNRF